MTIEMASHCCIDDLSFPVYINEYSFYYIFMPRPRLIPDESIFLVIRALLAEGGERAVSFSSVALKSGLSAPSLVQRYASRESMLQAALIAGWDALDRATEAAIKATPRSPKGAVALLKALSPEDPARPASELAVLAADFNEPVLRGRATKWRSMIVAALNERLGGGKKNADAGEILFVAWQGRMLWLATGDDGFRLKDLVKRLADAG